MDFNLCNINTNITFDIPMMFRSYFNMLPYYGKQNMLFIGENLKKKLKLEKK